MWNIEEMTGYKPMTTFWQDFSIADRFGRYAIQETYDRAFKEWKTDYKYLTELVMVLNWKMWKKKKKDILISALYRRLFEETDEYATTHLKGKELSYYFSTTD